MEQAFIPSADSIMGGGSTTAPVSHGVFAQLAVTPPAGKYHIKARYALSGTAETALANVEINVNSATYAGGFPTITGSGWNELDFYVTLNGSSIPSLRATAAGTAGAVYSGSLIVTKLS